MICGKTTTKKRPLKCKNCWCFNRYLKCDLETFDLRDLHCKFDVILVEPPLEEYQRTQGAVFDKYWDWDEVFL